MKFITYTNKLKFNDGKEIFFFSYFINRSINLLQLLYIKKKKWNAYGINSECRNEYITVSLTSFPKRIEAVELTIKSLLNQTYKPDEIQLWLAECQFKNKVPENLLPLIDLGVDIKFCDDLKSHKKYYYALKEQKDNLVITVDDDLLYPENLIETLLEKHKKFPNSIVCYRTKTIHINEDGFDKYSTWECISNTGIKRPSLFLMPSTGAGTLYPPNALDKRCFDKELLQKYALTADDIWIKFMSMLQGTAIIKTHKNCRYLSEIHIKNNERLTDDNVYSGGNDDCIKKLDKLFPEVRMKLAEQMRKEGKYNENNKYF